MKNTDHRDQNEQHRPMKTISMRLPEDVITELKRLAPLLGMSGYQPLIRWYINTGLRGSLLELQSSQREHVAMILRERGMSDDQISEIVKDL